MASFSLLNSRDIILYKLKKELDVKRRIESGGYCKLISAISPLERRSLFANSMILTV